MGAAGGMGMGSGMGNGMGTTALGDGQHHAPGTTSTGQAVGTGTNHGGSSLTGKIQSAAGTILHSSSLKAKGEEKEREAQQVKMQSAEIAEAERLERDARARRERAVAAGAHPDHGHLGGVVPPRHDQY